MGPLFVLECIEDRALGCLEQGLGLVEVERLGRPAEATARHAAQASCKRQNQSFALALVVTRLSACPWPYADAGPAR
jgi:hypothetical protein